MKKDNTLKEGFYYWVIDNTGLFIAQYVGDYWQADISVTIDEFNKSCKVIEEIKVPKGYESEDVV